MICTACDRDFSYRREGGGTQAKCNSCHVKERRRKLKQILVEEHGGKCEICGYSRCVQSLQFHHFDPKLKEFAMACSRTIGLNKLRTEAQKCVLLCSNCHGEVENGITEIPTQVAKRFNALL